MNVWNHHSALIHPVNAYLIRSVRNYCLNYLEINATKSPLYQMYKENLLSIQELQMNADPHPLKTIWRIRNSGENLSCRGFLAAKCRDIFVQYLYNKT